jgi:amino acid transporter
LIALINFRGVKITGWVQDLLSYSMITFMVIVGIYAISRYGVDGRELIHPGGVKNVFEAAAVGVFLYVGFEWVTPLAEEVTDSRMIAKGMMIAIGLLCLTYVVFITGMIVVIDKAVLSSSEIPHILVGRALFGEIGVLVFVLMSILASLTSYNAGFLNFSRFMYAMGRDNVLPRVFSAISTRYATPWFAILFCFILSLLISVYIYFNQNYMRLILVSAAIEVIIYSVMALSVIKLRFSQRDTERPYRVPGGLVIPVVAVLFFMVLLVGIYSDDIFVLYIMIGVFLLCLLYTLLVVPRLRAAHQRRMAARTPRRRRRPG